MNQRVPLTITSLFLVLVTTFHLADDIVYGMSPGGVANLPVVVVLAGWLYSTLAFAGRRLGLGINLVLSLLASGIPVIHMTGSGGVTGGIESGGAFFFAWTLLALGVTAILSVILSVRGLWSLRRGPAG